MSIYVPRDALVVLSREKQITIHHSLLVANKHNRREDDQAIPSNQDTTLTSTMGLAVSRTGEPLTDVRTVPNPIKGYDFGVCIEQHQGRALNLVVVYRFDLKSQWQFLIQVPVHLGMVDTIDGAHRLLNQTIDEVNLMVNEVFGMNNEQNVVEWFLWAIDHALTTDGDNFTLDFSKPKE